MSPLLKVKTFLKTEESKNTQRGKVSNSNISIWEERASWAGSDSALEWVESPSSRVLTQPTPSSKVSNSNILIFGTKSVFGAAEASQMPKQNKQGTE